MSGLDDARRSMGGLAPAQRGIVPARRTIGRGDRWAAWAGIATGAVLALGFLLRAIAASHLTPHVDEPSSLLAARMVAERGIPLLPSGTAYFQGATLSYLLQPFIWLGIGDLDHLRLMRMVPVLAGVVAISLATRLGTLVTGDARVGLLMAALVALDPLSVQWSGHLRMYGLLQPVTFGLAWSAILLLVHGATTGRMALVVALFWAAVFTHIGAALLGPALVLAAFVIHRRSLFRQWRLLLTFGLCALAPATLLLLNQLFGTTRAPTPANGSSRSAFLFVGDNLLAPLARIQAGPHVLDWGAPFRAGNLFWLVPMVLVGAATLAGGRLLLRSPGQSHEMRCGAILLLSFYWVSMVAVLLFTVSPKERYLLNVHLLGYCFVAALLARLATADPAWRPLLRGFAAALGIALVAGMAWRLHHPVVHPDYNAAMAHVVAHHEPGQPIIVALPPVAWLALDEADRHDLSFLAGPQDQKRAQGYTRLNEDGALVDYWIGASAITSSEDLRAIIHGHPDAWIVVDAERLRADWAYRGAIEQVLLDSTVTVYEEPGGAMILRAAP